MDSDSGMFIPVFDELLSYCSVSSWEPRKDPTGMTMSRPEDSLGKVEKWKILKWFPVVEVRTEIQEESKTRFT